MKILITDEQKEEVKRLYLLQKHTIRQIMELTGVRSEQTIYVILDEAHIPRFKTRNIVRRISVGIDKELNNIIEKEKPKNTAEFICNMAKEGYYAKFKKE